MLPVVECNGFRILAHTYKVEPQVPLPPQHAEVQPHKAAPEHTGGQPRAYGSVPQQKPHQPGRHTPQHPGKSDTVENLADDSDDEEHGGVCEVWHIVADALVGVVNAGSLQLEGEEGPVREVSPQEAGRQPPPPLQLQPCLKPICKGEAGRGHGNDAHKLPDGAVEARPIFFRHGCLDVPLRIADPHQQQCCHEAGDDGGCRVAASFPPLLPLEPLAAHPVPFGKHLTQWPVWSSLLSCRAVAGANRCGIQDFNGDKRSRLGSRQQWLRLPAFASAHHCPVGDLSLMQIGFAFF
mmetsp:Transcript_14977/g.45204  ORF Transcript_14977/g.45204 Transcript_14977/m.45204 type:complete len:294 (+) Transcript_14977:1490-2371(+)